MVTDVSPSEALSSTATSRPSLVNSRSSGGVLPSSSYSQPAACMASRYHACTSAGVLSLTVYTVARPMANRSVAPSISGTPSTTSGAATPAGASIVIGSLIMVTLVSMRIVSALPSAFLTVYV